MIERPLRLPSPHRHPWVSVLILGSLAIAANQVGFDLFYGAHFYLGSIAVVLALLLLGRRGVLVGLASILLAPRLWGQPQTMVVLLAELLWLAAFLHLGSDRSERRERGDVVLIDVLFWIAVAIPLNFFFSGVIANLDLATVLDVSLLQAINGVFNATAAYGAFVLIRILQCRRNPARSVSLQGLVLVSLLSLALLTGMVSLSVGMRQLDREVIDDQLTRFRQLALTSTVLESEALADLSGLHRRQESPLDVQVFDGRGRLIFSSNPPLFQTLEALYAEPGSSLARVPQVAEPLDLLIPAGSQGFSPAGLRGYWRYQSTDDQMALRGPLSTSVVDRIVVIVEPARAGIRELQVQSSHAIRLMALLVLVAVIVAREVSRFIVRQVPGQSALQLVHREGDRLVSAADLGLAADPSGSESLRSGLQELQPLLEALRSRAGVLIHLRESFRRSERQRQRLETEVGRLSIIDPLTGCFNRRELYRRLEHELRLSGREARALSFLCLEIDHLRQIHDSYGKLVSEEVLRRVAMELRNRSRATDFLCRLGPEQFGLLLTACDSASAGKVAHLLSEVIRSLEIRHEGSILAVTISVGVASLQFGRDDSDALITRSHSALYRAKAEGRDRVVIV